MKQTTLTNEIYSSSVSLTFKPVFKVIKDKFKKRMHTILILNPKTKTMKKFVAFKQSIMKFVLFVSATALYVHTQAQPSNELNFDNSSSQIHPVKMVSFTAALNNNKADLKWSTASEISVSHFVIERSTDGTNYNDAGVIFAYGNATDKSNYSFSDNLNNIQSGDVYYRLYSVTTDGKGQYYETRIIRSGK